MNEQLLNPNEFAQSLLTPLLFFLKLVLLLAVLFVIIWDVGIRCLVMVAIVRWWRFTSAVQPWKLGRADFLRARATCHTPWVFSPALLSRTAAAGGQEALSHGCCGLVTALAAWTSPLHHTCSTSKYCHCCDHPRWTSYAVVWVKSA